MKKILITLAVLMVCGGCSLEVVHVDSWPDRCNFVATLARAEYKDKSKSITATWVQKCFDAFDKRDKEKKEKKCRLEIFGKDVVDYDSKLYKNYEICKK